MTHQYPHFSKRQRLSLSLLLIALWFTMTTFAQDASQTPSEPTPAPSLTHTPMPIQPTATPTLTPLPDPTLSAIMSQREVLSLSNSMNLREFYGWPAYEKEVTSIVFTSHNELVSTGWAAPHPNSFVRRWNFQDGGANPIGDRFEGLATGGEIAWTIQASDDGRFLLAAGGGPGVTIWDAPTSRKILFIDVSYASTAAIYNRRTVIIGGSNGLVSLWDVLLPYGPSSDYYETGVLPQEFVFTPRPSTLISAFQVDGEVIQVAHDQGTSFALTRTATLYLHTWNINESVTRISRDPAIFDNPLSELIMPLVLDRNRQYVYYGAVYSEMYIYDYGNHRTVAFIGVKEGITCLALDPTGAILIIGDAAENGSLHLYNTETFEPIGQINTGHTLTSCVFNQDGTLMALGDTKGQIALWGVSPE